MGNMSYCRFENTAKDLADCWENFDDDLTSDYEIRGRKHIVKLAVEIAENYADMIGKEVIVNDIEE